LFGTLNFATSITHFYFITFHRSALKIIEKYYNFCF
jgi:hypothetical protein